MIKKTVMAAIVISVFLLSLVAEMQVVKVAEANPMFNVKSAYESFVIESPQNGSTNEGSILLKFTVNTNAPSDMHNNYCYKIDDAKPVLIANISVVEGTLVSNDVNPNSISGEGIYNPNPPYYIPYVDYVLEGNVSLPPLSEGWHNLTVNRGTAISDPKIQSPKVRFFISATPTAFPDPQKEYPNSWSILTSLPSAWQSAQTAVVNDKIYVVGDFWDKGSYLLINYVYDPETNNWQTKTPTPTSRYGASMLVYENKIYLVSGFTGGGINPPATLAYDPSSDTWTSMAPASIIRMDVFAAVLDGKIYVTGGTGTNPYDPGPAIDETEAYDISNNSWSKMAPIPVGVTRGFSSVIDGKIYIFGQTQQADLIVQVFDPLTDKWSKAANPPTSVERYASVVVGNKVFLIGGSDNYTYPTTVYNLVQIYDPKTDTWREGEHMPVGVFWSATGLTMGVIAPERIYVFGGCNDTKFSRTNLTQVFDPQNNSWSLGEPMTFTRWNFGVANVNDSLYVFGGVNYITVDIAVNEKYTPIGYGMVPLPSTPSSPSSSLSPSPSIREFPFGFVLLMAFAVMVAAVVHRRGKRK